MLRKSLITLSVFLPLLVMTGNTASAQSVAEAVNEIANREHRSEAYRARNEFRNPGATLEFFGLRPDMTVVEVSPGGGGWYTEILAPYLRDNGTFYVGAFDPESESEYSQRNHKRFGEKLAAHPELYDKANVTVFAPPAKLDAAPAGSADMVVTFRNFHGWLNRGHQQVIMQAMFDFLKPGGVLGLVQHRAAPSAEKEPDFGTGYVPEDVLIALAESVGFTLEAKSEINANPKDTKDHPNGVWNLPPGYRDGDTDREKYAAIGESDRMTLRFRKPE